MIRGLIRLAMYFGFGYVVLKFVNRLLISYGKAPLTGSRASRLHNPNSFKNVIDLCPRCGSLKEFNHRCKN